MRRVLPVLIRDLIGILTLVAGLLWLPTAQIAHASYAPLTLRYQHHLFTLDPDQYPGWRRPEDVWTFESREIVPPPEFRVDGDDIPPLPPGYAKTQRYGWREDMIRRSIDDRIASALDRPTGSVTIGRTLSGSIVFDGVGLTGRAVDSAATAALIVQALQHGVTDIELPVTETQPTVIVTDVKLQELGIKEVVTIGESNFAGSPVNRRHNIGVGLSKFNGHLIPQGTEFSFDKVLGRVDGTTGYRKELVIKGAKTEPDYGGGLCQVSTTAYRGVWEYGFPITARTNHSYAVSYYGPQGTDATVYPPFPDMRFTNDGPSALLMQTHHDEDDHAYFIYYGTKDKRQSEVWGPVVLSTTPAPPDREVFTTEIPPGERKKVGDRHPGVTVLWFRTRTPESATEPIVEPVLSVYEARPLFYEVGVAALPEESGGTAPIGPPAPDWIGTTPTSIE